MLGYKSSYIYDINYIIYIFILYMCGQNVTFLYQTVIVNLHFPLNFHPFMHLFKIRDELVPKSKPLFVKLIDFQGKFNRF